MKPCTVQLLTGGIIAALAVAATPTLAAPPVRYQSSQGHSVVVEGTSNIHDWTGTTDRIHGWVEIPGKWVDTAGELRLEPDLQNKDVTPRIVTQIPTKTLEGNRSGLAKNMHKALNVSKHPHAIFRMASLSQSEATDNGTKWVAKGELTVAGQRRNVVLDLKVAPLTNDRIRIDLTKDLLMTDFGIDPPTAMLGMARAADQVQVRITWLLQRQTPQPTAPRDASSADHRQAMSSVLDAYEQARAALAAEDKQKARPALAEVVSQVNALAEINHESLSESVQADWHKALGRLQGAAANAAEATSLSATRAAFAVLSQALEEAIGIVGHAHDATPQAYRINGASGIAGSMWLQTPTGEPSSIRSPYVSRDSRQAPQVTAIYASPIELAD